MVVENLEIGVVSTTTSADAAASAIRKLANSLKYLQKTLEPASIKKFSNTMSQLNASLNLISAGTVEKVNSLANSLTNLVAGVSALSTKKISFAWIPTVSAQMAKLSERELKLVESFASITGGLAAVDGELQAKPDDAEPAADALNDVGEATQKAGEKSYKFGDAIRRFGENIKKSGENAKNSSSSFSKLVKSIGRIAMYRMIRTAMKEITQAFKEGLGNAYQFSKATGGELAASLDKLASASLKMKNQMGAAFGALLQAVQPILIQLINWVTKAATALTQFFAALSGSSTYLKAKDNATEWAAASDAANEYKNTVLGFDELNKLDSKPGGGSSGVQIGDMFETAELPAWAQKLSDFVSEIKLKFTDVYGEFGNLDGEKIRSDLLDNLEGILGLTLTGATIGGVKGAILGLTVGLALSFLSSLTGVDGSVYASNILAWMKLRNVLPVVGAILGWKFTHSAAGALIGLTIGVALSIVFGDMLDDVGGGISNFGVLDMCERICAVVLPVAGALLGAFIIHGPAGWLLGITLGALLGFEILGLDDVDGKFSEETQYQFNRKLDRLHLLNYCTIDEQTGRATITIPSILKWVIQESQVDTSKLSTEAKKLWDSNSGLFMTDVFTSSVSAYGSIPLSANGGTFSKGDLFIAGEAGAEIVSSHGGQTQVSNTDQIAMSVEAGNGVIVSAIYAMANAIVKSVDEKDTSPVVTIGDREVYRAAERGRKSVGSNLATIV